MRFRKHRKSPTGCGIPEENLDKVFDSFFTTKEPNKGTGLGLGISYSIVDSMKGTITVQSTLNQGATFTIILPLSINPS